MGITCLVTVHGIGFQEPPRDGVPGYADSLQAKLAARLKELLSDDPGRQGYQSGDKVPIYVRSQWPVDPAEGKPTREAGLTRLEGPLVSGDARIAHVALVYSNLEDIGPQPEASVELLARGTVEHAHYASIAGIVHTLFSDGMAAIKHHPEPSGGGLHVRTDVAVHTRHRLHLPFRKPAAVGVMQDLLATLLCLEEDVAGYVVRNDLRMRIGQFVREALLRLTARADIDHLVLNTHSNGTVIGLDVLRQLPAPAIDKVRLFLTAGSPLRKYVELFTWGADVGVAKDVDWQNWLDPKDPVADSLKDLFYSQDLDDPDTVPKSIEETEIDNIGNSEGGGLRAHNYWDNDAQFVKPLAEQLRAISA